jgi:hypothetical protein
MKQPIHRTPPVPAATSLPRNRFRIEKLEERIAPKKGGKGSNNTCSCPGGSFDGSTIY